MEAALGVSVDLEGRNVTEHPQVAVPLTSEAPPALVVGGRPCANDTYPETTKPDPRAGDPPVVSWTGKRGGNGRRRAVDREDLKKMKKPRIDKFDEFVEWMDGDASLRYHPKDADARKHLSGWAMRNTNNHNKKVLKKSCLGVFVCSRSCRSVSGDLVTVRPATSDRARRKQSEKKCPRPGCDGHLVHVACTGKNGYPVTHFWRVTDLVVIFQSKGRHDHPRPDVVKTPSVAKRALYEYHRAHKHERPKDICKRMGVHIHKSFSRVDRVARQLREVQSGLSKDEINDECSNEEASEGNQHGGYSLRSPLTRMWASQNQTKSGNSNIHQSRSGVTIPSGGIQHHPISSNYCPDQDQYDTYWRGTYQMAPPPPPPPQHGPQADYQQHFMTDYQAQLPTGTDYYGSNAYAGYQLSSDTLFDSSTSADDYQTATAATMAAKSDAALENSKMTELMVMKDALSVPKSTKFGSQMPAEINTGHYELPVGSDCQLDNVSLGLHPSTNHNSPLKRNMPPALHHIDAKRAKLNSTESTLFESNTPMNIDMSSFSDIFDISASLGEEGLAGRPKTPVFHTASPPIHESPTKPTGTSIASDHSSVTSPAPSPTTTHSAGSPARCTEDHHDPGLLSPTSYKYRQLLHHHHSPSGPVLTQLTTHSHHQIPSTPAAEDENGTYIDFLVSMYLKDSEKPISTLKNELHVYTERNNQKTITSPSSSYRKDSSLQYATHPEHFKSPTATQFDFSWYDTDRRNQAFRSPTSSSTVTNGLLSPLGLSAHFDYPSPFVKDVYCAAEQTTSESASRSVLFMRSNAACNSLNRHVY